MNDDYPMQPQEEALWCWAAVSLSVDRYFNRQSPRTQCSIASAVKQGRDCCNNRPSCDEAAELHDALIHVRRFRQRIEGSISFERVRDLIRAGYPVCVRIGWWPFGGHFVVITGYAISDTGEAFVTVADPRYESGSWSYDEFCFSYFGIGRWTHTYLVQP